MQFWRLRFFFLLASQSTWAFDFKSIAFKNYIECLSYFHKEKPGLYMPPEFIRFDLIDEKILLALQLKANSSCQAATKHVPLTRAHQEKLSASRQANYELELVLKKNKFLLKKFIGTTPELLSLMIELNRVALSPLDPLFLNASEVGKKISKDLALLKSQEIKGLSLDSDKKTLKIQFSSPKQSDETYVLKFVDTNKSTNSILLKSSKQNGNSTEALSGDVQLNRSLLRGTFFSSRTSDDYPFGIYPKPKDMIQTEGDASHSHFSGDGHQH